MKVRLVYKIIAAFVLTSILMLALMVGFLQFQASRNFADYVANRELESLDSFVEELAKVYEEHNGWEPLQDNPRYWHRLVSSDFRSKEDSDEGPPMERNDPEKRPPGRDRGQPHRPPRGNPFTMMKPPSWDPFLIGPRLSLLDGQKEIVIGMASSTEEQIMTAIEVGGKIVGWLALEKRKSLSHPLDKDFLKQQYKAFYVIGCGILVIAIIVSFLLSRHLLAPIRRLINGTQALASRRFDIRIDVDTGDELGQLATDFNTMARTIEKYEEMRQQWISDIAHELRNPLSILRGEIEAMQDGVRDMNTEIIESLHAEVLQLSKIVEELHTLSLAETGAICFKMEPVPLTKLLRDSLAFFETRFNRHGIEVESRLGDALDCSITGDADRLKQVFTNVLENTLRFTDPPGKLKVWQEVNAGRVALFFEDTTPGVPEASLDRLFDRLYRVDPSRSRNLGGSGLGLAICKKIVESFEGTIAAMNAASGGLLIVIEFPQLLERRDG